MSPSIFHKILRSQSSRIFSLAAKSPPPPPLIHLLPVCQPTAVQFPLFNGPGNADPALTGSRFPCFSLGFFLKPETVKTDLTDLDGVVSGDAPTVWADSVKKKRKKKMNKHKLKKLRKRTSKKT